MEELTIEEKAQRYDEAIKVAKSNYGTIVQMDNDCTFAKKGIVNVFHHMFPELKESEDERIRKELLDFCKNRAEKYSNDPKYKNISAWIAWLEKQGEKTLVDKIQLGKKYKCIASPRYLMNFCSDCFEPLEALEDGEQKTVEWREGDEKMRKTAISLLTHPIAIKNNEGARKGVVEWLKHIKPPYFCDTCKLKP